MLASVSSHVGLSVGRSFGFQSLEKPDFSQHEQEFLHEGHGFSRHEHGFSREPLLHEPLSMVGGSALGQLSCGSSEVQLVGQLPARVVDLLQSSAVGEPCQDHRLCQDLSGTLPPATPATSSGPGPAQQSACDVSVQSACGMSLQSACGMSLESARGIRSVGRSAGCVGVGVSQFVFSPACLAGTLFVKQCFHVHFCARSGNRLSCMLFSCECFHDCFHVQTCCEILWTALSAAASLERVRTKFQLRPRVLEAQLRIS